MLIPYHALSQPHDRLDEAYEALAAIVKSSPLAMAEAILGVILADAEGWAALDPDSTLFDVGAYIASVATKAGPLKISRSKWIEILRTRVRGWQRGSAISSKAEIDDAYHVIRKPETLARIFQIFDGQEGRGVVYSALIVGWADKYGFNSQPSRWRFDGDRVAITGGAVNTIMDTYGEQGVNLASAYGRVQQRARQQRIQEAAEAAARMAAFIPQTSRMEAEAVGMQASLEAVIDNERLARPANPSGRGWRTAEERRRIFEASQREREAEIAARDAERRSSQLQAVVALEAARIADSEIDIPDTMDRRFALMEIDDTPAEVEVVAPETLDRFGGLEIDDTPAPVAPSAQETSSRFGGLEID